MTEYVFYKICCNDLDIKYTYVGSTTNFRRRKCSHKSNCNNEKENHYKVYKTMNEHGGWDNWTMVMIEKAVCESNLDARKRERHWYEELNADLNTQLPQMNKEDILARDKRRYKANKEQRNAHGRAYYEANIEQIKAKNKAYREANKEKVNAQKKAYSEANKDKINAKHKKWREENKEKLQQIRSEKHQCPCGGRYTHVNKVKHEKTKKHQQFINQTIHSLLKGN